MENLNVNKIESNFDENKIINNFEKTISSEGSFSCYIYKTRETHIQNFESSPKEIASSAIVLGTVLYKYPNLEITKKICDYLKKYLNKDNTISFFENPDILPPDADTTAYVLSALYKTGALDKNILENVARKVIYNTNKDGTIEVYLNPTEKENRIDPVALCNILYMISLSGIEVNENKENQIRVIEKHLSSGEYLNGSRYYFSPDFFLYFLSKLIHDFPNEYDKLKEKTINALQTRVGTTKYPIDMAMRLTSMKLFGLDNNIDKDNLTKMQDKDGNFPSDCIYKYGGKNGYFGSQIISDSFCSEALTK